MQTIRSASTLLASAGSTAGLRAIAATLGFGPEAPLDAGTRAALGIPVTFPGAAVAGGPGALRALLLAHDGSILGGAPLRESVHRLATRLATRAPHALWLALVSDAAGGVAIAAWQGSSPPRVAALIADRSGIVDSDAETVCALAAVAGGADTLVHARWMDVLGRDALSRRFYRLLEAIVLDLAASLGPRLPADDGRTIALLTVSRLLFLAFVETRGWLAGDKGWLSHAFDQCMATGGMAHQRLLRPLFFGTLNTPVSRRAPAARALGRLPFLNGGLFAPAPVEKRWSRLRFDDAHLGRVMGDLLGRHRFTAREDASTFSEAAVDPEMLGRAFESLMMSRERRASGTYFTPPAVVERAVTQALAAALSGDGVSEDDVRAALGVAGVAPRLRRGVRGTLAARGAALRVLDPACGSGAFLVHALDRLAALRLACGDARAADMIRREVLARSIFGVDVHPTAVWLCELRLWLSVVIESDEGDPHRVVPLPNLDRHIRTGDTLSGADFAAGGTTVPGSAAIARLRDRYARATGTRKRTLARALDGAERAHALRGADAEVARASERRRELVCALRGRDLFGERRRLSADDRRELDEVRARVREARARRRALAGGGALPFGFATQFPDAAAAGGFDVIVGNPPWVRLHHIPPASRERLRRTFSVFRAAAWREGAEGAQAGAGFAAQVDLAALFLERSAGVLRQGGAMALLVPAKLWRSLAGGGVRRHLLERVTLRTVEDWSEAPAMFDAATYPSLVVARREPTGAGAAVHVVQHGRHGPLAWEVPFATLALDGQPESPWLLAPPPVRAAFDRVRAAGQPMAQSPLGRPLLGVKCGANDAFVVRLRRVGPQVAQVEGGERRGAVEVAVLRPLLRGEAVRPWRTEVNGEAIVWTHGADGTVADTLPPHAASWLRGWRRTLEARSDARGARWWGLFRTEAARSDLPRVAWADVARRPRATVITAGDATVPLNSCYVSRCATPHDAAALAALLNSPLAAAWLSLVAEPARGAYRRYLGWTMALLPVPRDWPRARALLAPLGERGLAGDPPGDAELLATAIRAFRARPVDVEPLVSWWAR
ncbi:MAG: hypothetical protein HYX65_03330 [Gemmatimonadetes bacterium]|nr:hypothetical protein [Gemmatimonadota bacterium]